MIHDLRKYSAMVPGKDVADYFSGFSTICT